MVRRFILILVIAVVGLVAASATTHAQTKDGRLISVYDRGAMKVFLTKERTLGDALKAQNITLDKRDTVEPALDEELIATDYRVNIYRARPVVVIDGAIRTKTVSPYQTAQQIARDAGIRVYDEDTATLRLSTNLVGYGAGLELTISRATPFTLDLYGRKTEVRTQAKTVGGMLEEKNIVLGEKGFVSVPENTPIVKGMEVRVWREGKQTVTVDEEISFSSQIVYDADRPLGYRAVKSPGEPGVRRVTYALEVQGGVEISRVEIANLLIRKPTKQTEVIGLYNDGSGLTVSRGAQYWTDSKGVTHRETYYDLNMSVVMQSCGEGGKYSVRPDGAKVDSRGYVIIAANYGVYPKCSVVETSLGLGKVYDTGGFALRHPTGFDLATDWTRADGI